MSKQYKLETLFSKNSSNKVIEWKLYIEVIKDDLFEEFLIKTYSGLYGKSMDNKPDTILIKEGKNIGKSNETTPFEQAMLEAKAKWKHKIERDGYISMKALGLQPALMTEDNILLTLPKHKSYVQGNYKVMKAVSLKDLKQEKLKFPMLYQHKLNGIRCTASLDASGNVQLLSKDGTHYNIPHIIEQLKQLFTVINSALVLDGELYIHKTILSDILSAVRKPNHNTMRLQFWVFDLSIDKVNQRERFEIMNSISVNINIPNILVLGYGTCNNYEEMLTQTQDSIDLGYEGAIFRNPDALYQFGKRNINMIKSKKFSDGEFLIINVLPYDKNPELGTLLCKNDINDLKFKVEYEANHEDKAEILKNKQNYIGKKATVLYYERTVTDLPFHAKCTAIRNYE